MTAARALLAVAGAAAVLAACHLGPEDRCGAATTCVNVEVNGYPFKEIDQLTFDVVYGTRHANTTIDAGGAISLPTSVPLTFALTDPALIDVELIAAGKLGGRVLGADARSIQLQLGDQISATLLLFSIRACTEGAVYCGGTGDIIAESQTLYRCTGGLPVYYARCAEACSPHFTDHGECVGLGLCSDGGHYCGGNKLDGDPSTLYVCKDFDATAPVLCPSGCVIRGGDGSDACR